MTWCLLRITVQNRWIMYLGESSWHSVSVDTKHHIHITQLRCRPWWHLIFEFKNRFITILTVFCSESRHEVAPLGSKVIDFWPIHVKYINFLTLHTHHVFSSCPYIRRAMCTLLSCDHSIHTAGKYVRLWCWFCSMGVCDIFF